MIRKLSILNGLAIIAVVCNHAAFFGLDAMFWWTQRYQPGASIPNYDQAYTIPYYVLVIIIKLTIFAIPAFLFLSGFFVAYMARGKQSQLNWKTISKRIFHLLIPYLIWSLMIFVYEWLESCLDSCQLEPISTYLAKLAFGNATHTYWYIPVIIQLFLLSPLLVPLAKSRWRLLLCITIVVHLSLIVLGYLRFLNVEMILDIPSDVKIRLFPSYLIYFVIGIIAGVMPKDFTHWLSRSKWWLLVGLLIFGTLSIFEDPIVTKIFTSYDNSVNSPMPQYGILTKSLYTIMFILCFLAFDKVNLPFSGFISYLGNRSYGIFLSHRPIMHVMSKLVYLLVPWLLAYQILYQPILILTGIGIPILLMVIIFKSRLRFAYRYLFG